jgi:hypothetical protein
MHTINTTTLSAAPFDKIWVQNIVISGTPQSKVTAVATLKPYNGSHTLDSSKTLIISDVFATAAADTEFAQCMTLLLEQVEKQAKLQNLI